MGKNSLFKNMPVHILGKILRIFRFTTRVYEQIQVEYYSKLGDGDKAVTTTAEPAAVDLSPVFVLSTGRCGTKTLAALVDLLPDADAHHEPDPKLVETSYMYYMKSCPDIPDDFWQGLLANNRDELIRQAFRSDKFYFETNNRLAMLSKLLTERYPKARYIHLVRHPYDFVRSAMRRKYYNNHVWDFARISPDKSDPFYQEWFKTGGLEKCAWLWAKTNSHILDIFNNISSERCLFVRSEDIFNNNGDSVSRVFNFMSQNKKMPGSDRVEKLLGMKLNQQTYGNFPKSGEWSIEDAVVLKKHCRPLMEKFGYDI